MLGAAGAVELIVAVLMLQEQKVTPCLNSDELNDQLEEYQKSDDWNGVKDPIAAFRHLLPEKALSKTINQVVALNYGFGGTNSAMSISRDL